MNIKVVRIIKDNVVEFSSKKGNGIGTWNYAKVEEGREYSIEFDIDPILKIGDNAKRISDKIYSIRHYNNVNEIQGVVDAVDEDGLIYFRLGEDCLIMIECEGEQIKEGDWLLLTIGAENLKVTTIGISPDWSTPL